MAKTTTIKNDIHIALSKAVLKSLDQTLKSCTPAEYWQLRNLDSIEALKHDHCVVLTISAFKFRLMILIHVTLDKATREFAADALGIKVEELDESVYLDYLLEMSNNLCGHLKRNLQASCPPLGMSTPNLLNRSSLSFDAIVKLSHVVHATATRRGTHTPLLAVSALVSQKDDSAFQIHALPEWDIENSSEVDNSGKLELF